MRREEAGWESKPSSTVLEGSGDQAGQFQNLQSLPVRMCAYVMYKCLKRMWPFII